MFNLVKYELKGYYKDFIIAIGIIALVSLGLLTRINVWQDQSIGGISFMLTFAAAVVVFAWNIKIFSRDMYEDSGYLLCTLPQRGYSILASKLITALSQSVIVGIVAMLFNYIVFQSLAHGKMDLSYVTKNINLSLAVFIILASLIEYVFFMTTIYFSITLSKVAIRKKKMGKLGSFIIFVIISVLFGKITQVLMDTFPKDMTFNLFQAKSEFFMNGVNAMHFNIASTIFNIIVFILMFVATSYIIENKLDF